LGYYGVGFAVGFYMPNQAFNRIAYQYYFMMEMSMQGEDIWQIAPYEPADSDDSVGTGAERGQ
jgi:hypothetical protein